MKGFFLFRFVLSAKMQHLLHFQNITTASISTGFDNKFDEIGELLVLDQLANFHGGFSFGLLAQEKQAQSKCKHSSEGIIQLFFLLFH